MFRYLRGLLSPKPFEAEKDLMAFILRVREVASAAYWWWTLWFGTFYIGAIATPLVAVGLADLGTIGLRGMKVLGLVTAGFVALIYLFNPRARLARIELAFNDLAGVSRMDAVIGPEDPQMRGRVKRRLARAIRCFGSAETAALANMSFDEGEQGQD